MSVDEADFRAAAQARRDFILSNLDSMSLKSCRVTLEQDMGLNTGALKPFKDLLSRLIDSWIAERDAQAAAGEQGEEEADEASEPEYDDSEDEGRAKKQRKSAGGKKQPAKRQKREEKPAKASGPRQYGKRVEKLRSVCRAATITIPPTLYVRNKGEGALEAALEELLAKHGLDADSGERAIAQVKAKLTTQRDLDGIDTSNIIEGGRRRRGTAPVSYKALVEPASDDEEEEESGSEAGSDSDVEAMSGSEAEADSDDGGRVAKAKPKQKAPPAKKQQKKGGGGKAKKAKAASDSEEEASSSEEEEEEAEASEASEEEAASESDGEAAAAARSPDENAAARGNGSGGRKGSKPPSSSKPAAKKRPAASLEDSDDEPVVAAGKRTVLADWSDDE